jgi:hypothetical protein
MKSSGMVESLRIRKAEMWVSIQMLLIILWMPAWMVTALCPNSCSGHGLCGSGNICRCYDGWSGGAADCSYSKYHSAMEAVVFDSSWHYLHRGMSLWNCLVRQSVC